MKNLAIAYVTCDKYEHVWEEWHDAFIEHWRDWDIPVYWCGESKLAIDDDFKQIFHKPVEVKHWTTKLRTQIEQIPEENIFIWLDDMPQQFNISKEFNALYDFFLKNDADALRIMGRASRAWYDEVGQIVDKPIHRLAKRSPYLVSYSPNIYKKKFLLEILQYDESPWASELNGSLRFWRPRRKIYTYHIDGWYINRVIQ
ncbi:hypothetical protein LCGC14_1822170 [marine sediment metagenome]|uniref:Uncharacterized protein n=1 Tax=marine sediment metagenome TaxID=412755 RepID=A0A0F9IYB0_9ZZZZ